MGPGPLEAICPASHPKAGSAQLLSFLTCLLKWFLKISNTGGSTTTSGNLVCVLYKSAAHLKLNATFNFAHLGPKQTFETRMLMLKDWRAHGHECLHSCPSSIPSTSQECTSTAATAANQQTSPSTLRWLQSRQIHRVIESTFRSVILSHSEV